MPLHPCRNLSPGNLQTCRCNIDQTHNPRFQLTCRDSRPTNQQRHPQPLDRQPLLAPGHRAAVIGKKHYHCVIEHTLGFEQLEDLSDTLIDRFDTLLVGEPIAPEKWVIGVMSWQLEGSDFRLRE